jgi:hypothetical protein
MPQPLRFTIVHESKATGARVGRVETPHGEFDTPAFMPVGSRGAVKGVTADQLRACGAQIVLANTYHLLLRPGPDIVRGLGGLHGFMGWDGPILTDSGGYQVFSLSHINAIDDDGVTFRFGRSSTAAPSVLGPGRPCPSRTTSAPTSSWPSTTARRPWKVRSAATSMPAGAPRWIARHGG